MRTGPVRRCRPPEAREPEGDGGARNASPAPFHDFGTRGLLMVTPLRFAGLLLVTTALTASAAWAQDVSGASAETGVSQQPEAGGEAVDVSIPGSGDIIVTG